MTNNITPQADVKRAGRKGMKIPPGNDRRFACTLLTAEPDKRLAKRYRDPQVKPDDYDAGFLFTADEVECESFDAFVQKLAELGPDQCLIRGRVRTEAQADVRDGCEVRRLAYDRGPDDPDGECPAAFESAARNWIVLDVDSSKVAFDPQDVEGSVDAWRATLPEDLRPAQSAFFLSASSHLSPTVRGKLLVALDSPLDDATAAAYAKANGFDGSVCHAVQPNYFAAPIFDGCVDPLAGKRAPIRFAGAPARLPAMPAGMIAAERTLGARDAVPDDLPEISYRGFALAETIRDRWLGGGRIESHAWLHLCGWCLARGWPKGELGAMLVELDRYEPDPLKVREHWHILGNAVAIEGAGGAREWLGDDFDKVDEMVNHNETNTAFAARLAARASTSEGWSESVSERDAQSNDSDDRSPNDPAVENAIEHLALPGTGVYQRAGRLVTVTHEACVTENYVRPEGAPTIRELPVIRIKEILRQRVQKITAQCASEIVARHEWRHIRPLDAIVSYPILRDDGSLLMASGYDIATRTLAEINIEVSVPDAPTLDDAQMALFILNDLVCDFPFENEAHRSAWLAMLLTVPARPAIDGPTPLGLFEATQRGSGKTLLADVLSVITTGEPVPRRTAPKTKEEWDKSMLAALLAGDPIVLFDNVTTTLTSDALDTVLTGTWYTQRILGVSETVRVPVRSVFLASANNATLSSDLVRRSIACRLAPEVELPETRTGFKYARLLAHVKANRADYLAAVLTILRAYAVAGRPKVKTRPTGNYDEWGRVVRDALVWAGAADPVETQDALRESADVERDEMQDLLAAWHELLGDRAITVKDLVNASGGVLVKGKSKPGTPPDADREKAAPLYDALRAIMPPGCEPDANLIGKILRRRRGTIIGGLVLRMRGKTKGASLTYQVVKV